MNYEQLINLIITLGDTLPSLSGKIVDIGVKKEWLTEKDIELEQKITAYIKTLKGDHSVFAEELNNNYKDAENVWVIDPISGTESFLKGWHHYAITVCHIHKGVIMFSAIYDPSVKELFTAYRGKGAFLNQEKITVNDKNDKKYIFFSTEPCAEKYFTKKQLANLFSQLTSLGSLKNVGSFGLQYSYVACGRADISINCNKDTFPEFAGKLILEESGGIMKDFMGNSLGINPQGIIACRKDLYEKTLNLIKNA